MKSLYTNGQALIEIEKYLKLRKEFWELLEKFDKLVEKIKELKEKQENNNELIEKLSKELAEKTRLLNQYHLDYGDEILEKIEKKTTKAKKNNDTDSIDIEELLK